MKSLFFRLFLFALMCSIAQAQQEHPGDVRLRECLQVLDTRGTDNAARAYLKMEEEFRGTAYGACALFEAAYWTEYPANVPIYQRVVDEYPNSGWDLPAKISILGFQLGSGRDFANALDELAQSLGGPSMAEISTIDDEVLVQRIVALPQVRQKMLWVVYHDFGLTLTQDMGQYAEALPLALFLRNAFSGSGVGDGGENFLVELCLNNGRAILKDKRVNPNVEILSPSEGGVTATLPTITSKVTVGDATHVQVDLAKVQVQIDGQDVRTNTNFRSEFASAIQNGLPFETVSVSTTPTAPLSEGQHTYTLVVPILGYTGQGPGQTTITRHFSVQTAPPDLDPTETRTSTKDALVYEKSPHSNEGANPRLTLEKINGKAARNLLGFDLAGVNTNSLTSATLVLSIDPSDQVSGWGNGETVSVKPVTVAWQEGNGKRFGLPGNQQTAGSGAGTTWFSPTDENISNNSSNGVVQWNGAATYATTGTAPALTVRNNQTGELRFDVTNDVLNGVNHGWLLRKDAENKGSKVSFYSREGGGASLGPRLILEHGGQTAMSGPDKIATAVAAFFGFKSRAMVLQASAGVSEGPKGLGEFLRGSQRAAFVGEQVLLGFAGHHPLTQLGARVAYRSWLRETPSLV